ncbi:hypothetical protein C8R45DRAFT_1177598 [Mycena sanguinolenta]|nr:hypothetical protein C8R45DRAFT_1177598 [Mycena sanguinolenta]
MTCVGTYTDQWQDLCFKLHPIGKRLDRLRYPDARADEQQFACTAMFTMGGVKVAAGYRGAFSASFTCFAVLRSSSRRAPDLLSSSLLRTAAPRSPPVPSLPSLPSSRSTLRSRPPSSPESSPAPLSLPSPALLAFHLLLLFPVVAVLTPLLSFPPAGASNSGSATSGTPPSDQHGAPPTRWAARAWAIFAGGERQSLLAILMGVRSILLSFSFGGTFFVDGDAVAAVGPARARLTPPPAVLPSRPHLLRLFAPALPSLFTRLRAALLSGAPNLAPSMGRQSDRHHVHEGDERLER